MIALVLHNTQHHTNNNPYIFHLPSFNPKSTIKPTATGTLAGQTAGAPTFAPTVSVGANVIATGTGAYVSNSTASMAAIDLTGKNVTSDQMAFPEAVDITYRSGGVEVQTGTVGLYSSGKDANNYRVFTAAMVVSSLSLTYVCSVNNFFYNNVDNVNATHPADTLYIWAKACVTVPFTVPITKKVVDTYADAMFGPFSAYSKDATSDGVYISNVKMSLYASNAFPTPAPTIAAPTMPPQASHEGVTGTVTTSWHNKNDCSDVYQQQQEIYGLCTWDSTTQKYIRQSTSAGVVTNPNLPYQVPIVQTVYSDSGCLNKISSSSATITVNECKNEGPFYVKTSYTYSNVAPDLLAANTAYVAYYTTQSQCNAGGAEGLVKREAFPPDVCLNFISPFFGPPTASSTSVSCGGGGIIQNDWASADCKGATFQYAVNVGGANNDCQTQTADKTYYKTICSAPPGAGTNGNGAATPGASDEDGMIVFMVLFIILLIILVASHREKLMEMFGGKKSQPMADAELTSSSTAPELLPPSTGNPIKASTEL